MNADNFSPIPFLDLKAQQARIGTVLRARLDAVLAHGQYILGPEVAELEGRLAAFCGAAHCVSVSSGTDALQIALMAEGIGRGDAVFLPAFTYTATAEVPLLLGAVPVFVDVDPRTFQIDLASLEARISDVKRAGVVRPRAVIGVDLFGQPADWAGLRAIAAREGLFTLDDCAQSFGAALDGERLGRAADATATSFFPSKPLGAYGDGGALFTESPERAALYRSLRTHGEGTTRYEVMRIGMNGRLDTMQAAILLAKLDVFEGELARREEIAGIYDAALAQAVEIPARVPGSKNAWAVYSVLLPDQALRDKCQAECKAAGIATAVYYPRALHQQPAYAACHDGVVLPVSEGLGARILALPIHPDLTDAQACRVAATLRGVALGNMPRGDLFPEIGPFETGYLPLSDGHVMYWEQVGNPRGKPVLFLHGGPGAGAGTVHRRFFDPSVWRVIIFDQRGAGRSKPLGGLVANTTPHLVEDIEVLRKFLGLERLLLFGGSWGSTLALAYAQAHPEAVIGAVLRGIFLGRAAEVEWFMHGMQRVFPDAHAAFAQFLPEAERGDLLGSYLKRLIDPDPQIHGPAARSWSVYEGSCSTLLPSLEAVSAFAQDRSALGLARIEAHYFANGLFLAKGGLLNHMEKLRNIPGEIVQGRYDMICPAQSAFELAAAWPTARLTLVPDAGHSALEPGVRTALIAALERCRNLT